MSLSDLDWGAVEALHRSTMTSSREEYSDFIDGEIICEEIEQVSIKPLGKPSQVRAVS